MPTSHRALTWRHAAVLAPALIAANPAAPAAAIFPGGRYELASRLQLPHLEEMRRTITRETRCIATDDARALFPVMRQPALNGCTFGYASRQAAHTRLVLVCASARVATGTVELRAGTHGLIGQLEVKMGGKNMTCSQRFESARFVHCDGGGDSPAP